MTKILLALLLTAQVWAGDDIIYPVFRPLSDRAIIPAIDTAELIRLFGSVVDSCPHQYEIYYVDTVGWREVGRDSIRGTFENTEPRLVFWPEYENPAERKIQWLVTIKQRPICDTIIIGYFYTNETKDMHKWRVRKR